LVTFLPSKSLLELLLSPVYDYCRRVIPRTCGI